jgi:integrase
LPIIGDKKELLVVKRKDTSNNTDETNQKEKKPRERKPRPRRIKGTGSVYPRSDGRWGADFIVEETGKKKTLYGKTAKEAQGKLDKALQEQKQGILATGPNQKLGDHLEWWLEGVHKAKLRIGTYLRYRSLLDVHILPELGHIQLRKLTTKQLQMFYNKKLKENLSPASVHKMHGILHSALKSAVKWRSISFNPADGIELPPDKPQREGQSLTLEQTRLLLKEAKGHRLEAFIALALTTGMRHGELAALRWDDINFEQGTVYIHCTVGYRGRHHFVEGDPKTEKSRRTVPLLPVMHDILESHRKEQNETRLRAGDSWQEKNLVFCTRTGGFLDPTHIRGAFYKLLDKIGLPRIHIHDLRHTASTLWQSLGIDPKVRQEMLGHSTLEMTMTVYSHVLPEMQKEAAERINKLFQEHS